MNEFLNLSIFSYQTNFFERFGDATLSQAFTQKLGQNFLTNLVWILSYSILQWMLLVMLVLLLLLLLLIMIRTRLLIKLIWMQLFIIV